MISAAALPDALAQTWPPFVLVLGLLLIGVLASSDGLFEALGSRLARSPGNRLSLFVSLMALVALVTVVLNLDTSVVFLTPILLHVARRRGVPEPAFLYGVVFMSNSASLLLPGSNLTNLLVLAPLHLSGGSFASHMFPSWIGSVVVTTVVLVVWRWRDFRGDDVRPGDVTPLRLGLGTIGVLFAITFVLLLANPALPVLAVAVVLGTVQIWRRRMTLEESLRVANPVTLLALFVVAVGLGTLARTWSGPGQLLNAAGPWGSAWLGAGVSNLVNNLPAAVLLSSRTPQHPLALLIGLDLGPNLVIIGALSAILWLRVARSEGANPSVVTYSKVGLVLVPLTMSTALVALRFFVPHSF